eukprot:768794-Hanusia_phi.AAC.2
MAMTMVIVMERRRKRGMEMKMQLMMVGRTVKANLDKGVLANPQQFKDDVLLVFKNAMTYNPEGHDVHVMAKTLKVLFEGKWSQNESMILDAYNNAGSASESTKSK